MSCKEECSRLLMREFSFTQHHTVDKC